MDCPSTSSENPFKKKYQVSCFVPKCPSNSLKFPNKLFLTVPNEPKTRKKWMKAARRQDTLSPKSVIRCCEDHFDMENDIENWVKYKLVGGKLVLKKDVIPHVFDCQGRIQRTKPRSVISKRERKEILQSIENEQATELEPLRSQVTSDQHVEKSRDVCLQIETYPHKRSKEVQVVMKSPTNTIAVSPIKVNVRHQMTSPIKMHTYKLIYSDSDSESKASYVENNSETGSMSGSVLSDILADAENEQNKLAQQVTMRNITRDSKLYLGVPQDCVLILDLIQKATLAPYNHICLVLKKLKLNESFKILANDFGLHETTASRIFSTTCPKIAKVLEKLIIKPTSHSVFTNLPIAFRQSYFKTYCIIDCMEIEIETPSDALHQSLTYSSYKKCNTIKYLVSATPDGIINFVSEGFGGRTSDTKICQESNFFNCLPHKVSIMADRGFKHIEGELAKRNFTLIRPPSVSSEKKSSREEVLRTKKIASLRIHIKRVIRRLREFAFLKPHACIDHNLIKYIDSAVIICSALINLQSSLIKY